MLLKGRQLLGSLRGTRSLTNCHSCLPLKFRRVGILADPPPLIARYYATAKPVSRPKAHTGRPTSTRKPKDAAVPKKATKTAAKTAKKPASPKKPKTKAKSKAKSKIKPRSKAKTKAKPKPKPKKVRKVLTEKQKAAVAAKKKRSDKKALKELALQPPATKPKSAWQAMVAEKSNGFITANLVTEYRNLSTELREHYNHIANQNKATYAIEYRRWIESHPAEVIHKANNARSLLRRQAPKSRGSWRKLHDDREVKQPLTAFLHFNVDRQNSGDFKGIPVPERSTRIGQEWKELPAEQRQPYFDTQKQDKARYEQEIKTVYNRDVVRTQTA